VNNEAVDLKPISGIYCKLKDTVFRTMFPEGKLITFCMCLKGRSDAAIESIKTIVNTKNAKLADFIIVEDESHDMLDTSRLKRQMPYLRHMVVNTEDSWNRSKLLNHGFRRAKTPLVAGWDSDFLFDKNYVHDVTEFCRQIDFTKYVVRVNSVESGDSLVNGKFYAKGSVRGGQWIYLLDTLKMVNGYDESFIDWGHEEMDFHERVERMRGISICTATDHDKNIVVTHKSHSDVIRGCENQGNNWDKRVIHEEQNVTVVNQNGWGICRPTRTSVTKENRKFADFLKDKTIALVGPAPTITGSKQGGFIDQFDVVIRLNKALPVPEDIAKDTGTRCDILYNCLNTDPECGGTITKEMIEGVKWVACPYPRYGSFESDVEKFVKWNTKQRPRTDFHVIDSNFYNSLEAHIGTRPNTGIGTILDILSFDVEVLYVTGFTFFKGGYHKDYRGYSEEHVMNFMAKYGKHSQEPQIELMKKIYASDDRLSVDAPLEKILIGS
jgi:hypothetical protein